MANSLVKLPSFAAGLLTIILLFTPLTIPPETSACTMAMIRGTATTDGRPLMFKTRDRSDFDQDFIYSDAGLYAFIGTAGAGVTTKIYGGINETGFGIINSNAYNFPDTVAGWADDGYIIKLALETCRTVYDFQYILDSTNTPGRTIPAQYGVMDAFGNAILYEATAGSYYICDLSDSTWAPNGYLVRSTFAYNGSHEHLAQFRHDRALALIDSGYQAGVLNRQYLTQYVLRDLCNPDVNPYPLPFDGKVGTDPYGFLHTETEDCINRAHTRVALIIQGIEAFDDPDLTTIWAMCGQPVTMVAIPLWVSAGSVPLEVDGPGYTQSALNAASEEYVHYLYATGYPYYDLDTWRLVDQWGGGVMAFLTGLEVELGAQGDSAWAIWAENGLPPQQEVADFQDQLAADALDGLSNWGPPAAPDVRLSLIEGNQIALDWDLVTLNIFERPVAVTGYTVYRSLQPFYDRYAGDSLTTVESPPVILPLSDDHFFYQVRCRE